jgi:hypothetical protein
MTSPDKITAITPSGRSSWQRLKDRVPAGRLAMGIIVLTSLAALAYGLVSNWQELADYDWEIVYWPILVGLSLYPVALGLAVATWRKILHQVGGQSRWQQDLRIYCASNITRRLPTLVWFVAGRIYLYDQIEVPKSVSSLAMLIEGVLILFSGLLLSMIIVPFSSSMGFIGQHSSKLIPLVFISLIVILRPRFLSRFVGWLARRLGHDQMITADVDYQHMLMWTIMYSLVWMVGGVILYLLVRTLYPLPIHNVPTVIGIWAIGGVVSHLAVLTPGGLGIKELTMATLLSNLIPTPIAIIVSIFARVWYSLNELLWFALTARLSRKPALRADQSDPDNLRPENGHKSGSQEAG